METLKYKCLQTDQPQTSFKLRYNQVSVTNPPEEQLETGLILVLIM